MSRRAPCAVACSSGCSRRPARPAPARTAAARRAEPTAGKPSQLQPAQSSCSIWQLAAQTHRRTSVHAPLRPANGHHPPALRFGGSLRLYARSPTSSTVPPHPTRATGSSPARHARRETERSLPPVPRPVPSPGATQSDRAVTCDDCSQPQPPTADGHVRGC